uniref:Uncharacterized protein n=2 Tax=Kalmanozyma brasiliensis (strain GHG001) TaxID=1365824 RepID=V5GVS7_KALBG
MPRTPTISSTSSPRSPRKERAREVAVIERVSDIGERYRRLQHGWFEDRPEEAASSGSLQELVQMNMAYLTKEEQGTGKEEGPGLDSRFFFQMPVYTGSPF